MNNKELVANEALKYEKNGMTIGLGTGSTANIFIEALAKKIKEESLDVKVVASSTVSQLKAQEVGLDYISLDQISKINLYVDGADELTKKLEVLKGRGYDLVREKLLAQASESFIVIGDKSKYVSKIGENYPIPVEITPFAWKITKNIIEKIAEDCVLRPNAAGDAFAITSCGNYVLDCKFKYSDLSKLNHEIASIPGVIEHGIFVKLAKVVLVANDGEIIKYN